MRRLHAIVHAYILGPVRLEADSVRAVRCLFSGLQRMLQDPRIEKGVAGY